MANRGNMSLGEYQVFIDLQLEKYNRDLKRAEQETENTARRMNKASRVRIEFTGLPGVVIGLELASQAIRTASGAARAASAIVRGDFEAAADAARHAGQLGAIAGSIADATLELTGITQFINKAEEAQRKHDESSRSRAMAIADAIERENALREKTIELARDLDDRAAVSRLPENQQDLAAFEKKMDRIVDKLYDARDRLVEQGIQDPAAINATIGRVRGAIDKVRQQLSDEMHDKDSADAEKARKKAEQEAKELADKARAAAERRYQIALRTAEATARIAGNEAEALRFKILQSPLDERRVAALDEIARLVEEQRRINERMERTRIARFGQVGPGVDPRAAFGVGAPRARGPDRQAEIAAILLRIHRQMIRNQFGAGVPPFALGVGP